jgi:hypothetical protein
MSRTVAFLSLSWPVANPLPRGAGCKEKVRLPITKVAEWSGGGSSGRGSMRIKSLSRLILHKTATKRFSHGKPFQAHRG